VLVGQRVATGPSGLQTGKPVSQPCHGLGRERAQIRGLACGLATLPGHRQCRVPLLQHRQQPREPVVPAPVVRMHQLRQEPQLGVDLAGMDLPLGRPKIGHVAGAPIRRIEGVVTGESVVPVAAAVKHRALTSSFVHPAHAGEDRGGELADHLATLSLEAGPALPGRSRPVAGEPVGHHEPRRRGEQHGDERRDPEGDASGWPAQSGHTRIVLRSSIWAQLGASPRDPGPLPDNRPEPPCPGLYLELLCIVVLGLGGGDMKLAKDLVAASATPMVLGILAEGESYGYAILRRINELSGGKLDWTEGLLYPLLHRLERLGYVESSWQSVAGGRRRKYYRITDRGLAELAEQRRQWATVTDALN